MSGGDDVPGAPLRLAAMAGDPAVSPEAARLPGYLAGHAARVFNRRMEAALRPHGLSMALLIPLLLLRRLGATTQRDLVRSSPVAQPAMVAALAKIERLGFIERTADAMDARSSRIVLTEDGMHMAAVGQMELRHANAIGLGGFSTTEANLLASLLERLILNLEDL